MSPVPPSSGRGHSSWPQTLAYWTATWGGGMSVAPQLIEGERRRVLKFGPYVPNVAEEGFSEVRGSKLPNSGRALWCRGGAVRGCCCLLATRSPRKQRGIVASGHRLL